jgi:hypothetical protein
VCLGSCHGALSRCCWCRVGGQVRVGSCKLRLSAACLVPPGQNRLLEAVANTFRIRGMRFTIWGSRAERRRETREPREQVHRAHWPHLGRITTESIGAYADMATHIGGRAGETTRAAVLAPRVDLNQQPCASDRTSWLFRTVSSRCSGCRGRIVATRLQHGRSLAFPYLPYGHCLQQRRRGGRRSSCGASQRLLLA